LKARLAQEHPTDMDAYIDGKDAFIKTHERLALVWLGCDKGIQVTEESIRRIVAAPKKATKKQENLLLADLPQWEIIEHGAEGNGRRELHRIYKFKTFEAAFNFMSAAATRIIPAQDHHPRWENMYNRVEVWLSTFDMENQITDRDLKLARSLEQLWEELGRGI
jgi:4a-hydroxytetrahydrobiopterin dehydratase